MKKSLFLIALSMCFMAQQSFSQTVIKWKNTLNWSYMNVYAWTDSQEHFGGWPGQNVLPDEEGWYSVSFDAASFNFIFNDGGSNQTENLASSGISICYNIVAGSSSTSATVSSTDCPVEQPLYGGGEGTQASPYVISEAAHLTALSGAASNWDKYFIVTAPFSMQGASFSSVGTSAKPFSGSFDGGFQKITGLSSQNGLFGYTNGASLSNIILADATTSGADYEAGALAGYAENTTIQNSYASGTVQTTNGFAGGLVGVSKGSTIGNCYAQVNVGASSGICIGGFVGVATASSVIRNAYATGNVTGANITATGGFVGKNEENSVIEFAYATGDVTSSKNYSGGFAGANYATIRNSAGATGTISSTADFAAKFGGNNNSRNISTNNITWEGTAGASNVSFGDQGTVQSKNSFLTTDYFTAAGWDFDADWVFDEEKYPRLSALEDQVYSYPFSNELLQININNTTLGDASVYPNPVDDQLIITGVKEVESIIMYNCMGAAITCTTKIEENSVELTGLASLSSGFYVVKVFAANGNIKSFKVLKK